VHVADDVGISLVSRHVRSPCPLRPPSCRLRFLISRSLPAPFRIPLLLCPLTFSLRSFGRARVRSRRPRPIALDCHPPVGSCSTSPSTLFASFLPFGLLFLSSLFFSRSPFLSLYLLVVPSPPANPLLVPFPAPSPSSSSPLFVLGVLASPLFRPFFFPSLSRPLFPPSSFPPFLFLLTPPRKSCEREIAVALVKLIWVGSARLSPLAASLPNWVRSPARCSAPQVHEHRPHWEAAPRRPRAACRRHARGSTRRRGSRRLPDFSLLARLAAITGDVGHRQRLVEHDLEVSCAVDRRADTGLFRGSAPA